MCDCELRPIPRRPGRFQPAPHRQNPIDINWNHFYRSPPWLSIYAQKAKPFRRGDRLLAEHSLTAHRTHAHLAWPAISLYIAGRCPCTFARGCALLLRALLMTTLEESPQHALAPLRRSQVALGSSHTGSLPCCVCSFTACVIQHVCFYGKIDAARHYLNSLRYAQG